MRDRITDTFRNSKQNVRIVIGGGGATGVELAGEIKSWIPELRRECGSKCDTEITIVESNPTILFNLDKRVSKRLYKGFKNWKFLSLRTQNYLK